MYRKTPKGGAGRGEGGGIKWPLTELIVHFNKHQGTIIILGDKIITVVQLFCLISATLFHGFTSYRILVQYDTMSDLIILLGQCDLYFMVQ